MKCTKCGKHMVEAIWGYHCICGHEEVLVEEQRSPTHEETVNQEIHDNFWYGNEPTTEEAKEYCDFWHGGN